LFAADIGRLAIPLHVVLRSLLIKERLKICDEKTVQQIREIPYRYEPIFKISSRSYATSPWRGFSSHAMVALNSPRIHERKTS